MQTIQFRFIKSPVQTSFNQNVCAIELIWIISRYIQTYIDMMNNKYISE